ncbi:MAG: molybdenum cofactor guanylyltransferase [Geobacter sp.]|nr:molybdenum cofactor guanylyltransferase [Geobacter sp.]
MSNRFHDITGVILVGGKSRRMGQDKAFLEIDGQPLAERIIQTLQTCFDRLLLVGDQPERFAATGVPIIPDIYPGSSLGGLYTGLKSAGTEQIFVTSCDIPFPNPALIRLLCSRIGPYDAVIPASCSGLEPLFACYGTTCLPVMQQALEAGNYRITSVLEQLQILRIASDLLRTVDPDGRSLLNINTPCDYAACREFSA